MQTRELFISLDHSKRQTTNSTPIPKILDSLKFDKELRTILRMLGATSLEKTFYENTTDSLKENLEEKKNKIDHFFKQINARYHYLSETDNEAYRSLYYITQILLLTEDKKYSEFDQFNYPYQILACFGRVNDDIEYTLQRFDKYCNTHNLIHYFKIFPKFLRELDRPINYANWRKIIADDNSPEALALFFQAIEVEKFLGRAPINMTEAKIIAKVIQADYEWSHEDFLQVFPLFFSDQARINFIASLNEKNISSIFQHKEGRILDNKIFCKVFNLIQQAIVQNELLIRIPRQIFQAIHQADYSEILKSVHVNSVSYIINSIGIEKFYRRELSLSYNIQMLPSAYEKIDYFIKLAKYDSNIILKGLRSNFDSTINLLPLDQRINFLFNCVGKEQCAFLVRNDNHFLEQILKNLESPDQLVFICEIIPAKDLKKCLNIIFENLKSAERLVLIQQVIPLDDLKVLQKNYREWREFKLRLSSEEKLALNRLAYSAEELDAKSILKNIKHTIFNTEWSFSFLQPAMNKNIKSGNAIKFDVKIPLKVYDQLKQIDYVHERSLSSTEALKNIKQIGYNNAKAIQHSKLSFFKGSTEEYFENNFKDEQSFMKSFGEKKFS